ncbi:nucleoprotein TPR-like [Diachasma alloeum]|uniref:nucleoprotein TPR-like n=1 Tax=Diachasma alloeum TaxID=454923 RepID=UPI000738350E|nr:nucleoprotein TPR-like [Diachasma alloeum]
METEESDQDILSRILSEAEVAQIPDGIATKLRTHFNENFEEFITAKAVFQHGKQNYEKKIEKLEKDCQAHQQDLDECKGKLEMAESYVTALQAKLDEEKGEIHKLQESLKHIQKENSDFRRQRDAAVDERDTLQLQAERRDHEVERLHTEVNSLSSQLQSAVAAKCHAQAESEEIKSQELNLVYKEKRLEQERSLITQQMSSLEIELAKKTSELQATRSEASARSLLTETRLSQLEEELRISNDTLIQLREVNANFQKRCDELTQKLEEQRNHELSMHSSYREEIGAQTRLADLYKGMAEEANAKAEEYTNAVKELQTIVEQATEQYGSLETEFAQFRLEHDEILLVKTTRIEELSGELEKANELLGSLKQERLDQAVEQLAPTAAITSRILKKGLSLTQIYTKLVDTVNELTVEKEENDKLKAQMEVILKEIEDKAPVLQRQRIDYEAAVANVETLSSRLDELLMENTRLQETADEATRISSHQSRENQRLKTELADLARQVCYLLKEVQESRTGSRLATGDEPTPMETDLASSQLISKRLVTFRDIEELQENNQKLLSIVRALSSRQEEIERSHDELQSGELKEKLARYLEQLSEMQAAQDRQSKMLEGLMRQRDMYKRMYQQASNQSPGQARDQEEQALSQQDSEGNSEDPLKSSSEQSEKSLQENKDRIEELEDKLSDAEIKLKAISDEYSTYKKEKAAHEKMLGDEVERLRKEADTNSTRCCRLKAQLDSSQERFNLLQSNVATYKSQIKALEDRCANYSTTIGKHEQSIMLLKDETLSAQSKLSRAEVQLENLRQERQHLRDNEGRLLKEREMLHRERQTQALLKADVESIKASLERAQAEGQLRTEVRLDDANRECAALRRRLQEEQDRFRELSSHLERQLSTAQERLAEEQSLGERLKAELDEARAAQGSGERKVEELEAKLREAISQSRSKPITGDENLAKRLQELELQLAGANAEIRSLVEQLKTARQQNQQYSDIADSTETQLKEITEQYQRQVRELEGALEAARNEAGGLNRRLKQLESELVQSQSGQQVTDSELRERLSSAEAKVEELDEVKGELELLKSDLQAATQAAHEAEEKYAREMMLHSNDLQALAKLRSDTENISKTVSDLTQARDAAVAALEAEKSFSLEREKKLKADVEEMERRIDDLDKQNGLLHSQIQELSDKTAIMQSSRTSLGGEQEAMDTSLENRSFVGEEDSKSTDQLLKIIKYLRREKDLAVTKLDVLRAENMRLKSQVENLEKRVKEAEEAVNSQREKSDIDVATTSKHAELLRKVETLNAIADSNRFLREERDSLSVKVTELSSQISILSEEVVPLREQARDFTAKTELLSQENAGLRSEAMRWRQRANALVERANKASPEDWRRLQTERENLSKLLTSEREIHAKKMEEFNALKGEKAKLEEQIVQLNRQIQTHGEEATKASEEARKLGQDLSEALADSTSKSNDLASLKKELDSKEAVLNDIKNKELQIRKIAKKYKMQYEELANRKAEEVPPAANPEEVQATQEREELLREEGRREIRQRITELEGQIEELTTTVTTLREEAEGLRRDIENLNRTSSEKEERTTRLLKTAKTRIMQLTESKSKCERELTDLKERMDSMSNDNEQSEQNARLVAIKSQLEGRVSRLEHEKAEINSEKETLLQRVGQLQRQLSAGVSGVSATSEPPTANIKPMASARAETPLASIRPLNVQTRTAAVLPTTASNPVLVAPQQQQQQQVVHTTETSSPTSSHTDYQPSTSTSVSQAGQSSLRQLAVQPQLSESAESTQREESENSDNGQQVQQPQPQQQQQSCQNQQSQQQQGPSQQTVQGQDHQQPPQTVALVSPRIEQQSLQQTQQTPGDQQQTIPSSSTQSVSTSQSSGHKRPRTLESPASGSGVVEGTDLRTDQPSPKAKRIRTQEMPTATSGSEVEYQVPTSSQRDQDEEAEDECVVVDCDEGGGHNQAPEEEEFDNDPYGEMEEDEEDEEEEEEELPYGVEEEVEGDNNEVEIMEEDSRSVQVPRQAQQAIPTGQPQQQQQQQQQQQSEAISSAGPTGEPPTFASRSSRGIAPMPRQQQHFLLPQQGYEDGGDDSIVPSTPTLFVPRRGDGFGEAVSSPQVPQGRFTFGDSAPSSTPSVTPTGGATVRTMFDASGSGVAQVVQEGMDDTRMDLTQLEDGGTGRSVPTTPLQVSPAADIPPSTSGGQMEEHEAPVTGSSAIPGSDQGVEGTAVPSIRVTDEQESELMEAVSGSSTAPGVSSDGVSSESDQQTNDPSGCGTGGSVDEDSVEGPGDEGEGDEEEGREAEASPSSNVRQRNTVTAGVNAANIISPEETRGAVTRRSARAAAQQYRGNPRGTRTPITWGSQGPAGQTSMRGVPTRGTAIDGTRGRSPRGRRARPKYPFPRY